MSNEDASGPAITLKLIPSFQFTSSERARLLGSAETDDTRLAQLSALEHKVSAIIWFRILLEKPAEYKELIVRIRSHLAMGRYTPEDIGTNEVELGQIRVLYYHISVVTWIEALRNKKYSYTECIQKIRDNLLSGNFSIEDFGTSEAQLSTYSR